MSRCTAPVYGHRSASAAANCPACSSRNYGRSYNSYPSYPSYSSSSNSSGGRGSSGGQSRSIKARWSTILYTPAEIRILTPVRENVEKRAELPDLRDVFLCHAWDDRKDAAKKLHDLLESKGVSVWFSEISLLSTQIQCRITEVQE